MEAQILNQPMFLDEVLKCVRFFSVIPTLLADAANDGGSGRAGVVIGRQRRRHRRAEERVRVGREI